MSPNATPQIVAVPDAEDAALVDEAHRLAEALAAVDDSADPPETPQRPAVVAVAFDGVVTPEEAAAGTPDEVLHVTRTKGTFASGAAGVRARSRALAEITDDARAVLLPDTADGADVAAATARRRRGACLTDCLLRVRNGELRGGRPAYGGRAYAEFEFNREPPVVTLNTEALGVPDRPPEGEPTERTVEVEVADDDRIRHVETFEVPEDDLSKARRIVAGGFGLGSADGFDLIENLADAFGAAVGASRPPSDEGWVPYDRQIGVTGKEIDVEIYVPCAISGDSYHMRSVNADHLIPINSDPEARIFNFADIGIVGDVYEYGPALAEAVRRARADGESAATEEVAE